MNKIQTSQEKFVVRSSAKAKRTFSQIIKIKCKLKMPKSM